MQFLNLHVEPSPPATIGGKIHSPQIPPSRAPAAHLIWRRAHKLLNQMRQSRAGRRPLQERDVTRKLKMERGVVCGRSFSEGLRTSTESETREIVRVVGVREPDGEVEK